MKLFSFSFLALALCSALVNGFGWDAGLDGELHADSPRPTLDVLVSNEYLYLSKGTIPVHRGVGIPKNTTRSHLGSLEARATSCPVGTVATCAANDPHCCPSSTPICCPVPNNNCCPSGSFCVGLATCCRNGASACGEGCCSAGTACCGGKICCQSGYVCASGQCVNQALSIQSVLSIRSVASAASAYSASIAAASSAAAAAASSAAAAAASSAAAAAANSAAAAAAASSAAAAASNSAAAAAASSAAAAAASSASVAASLSEAAAASSAAAAGAEASRSFESARSQSAASASSASLASVSAQLAGQGSTINTANVSPADSRVQYNPPNTWVDVTSSSGIGLCTNGTKATNRAAASLSFVFKGTAIALSIIPSLQGGSFTVQIDGENANSLSSKAPAGQAGDQCVPSTIYSRDNLADQAHKIVIANGDATTGSSGATLEFNGFTYTGLGAYGTDTSPASSGPSSTVIGASVGGALGALLLLGVGVLVCLRQKKRGNREDTPDMIARSPGPTSATQPIMYQPQPGIPYTPGTASTNSPTFPPSAYDGMQGPVMTAMAGVGARDSGANYPYLPQAQTPDPYRASRAGMPQQEWGQSFYNSNVAAAQQQQQPNPPLYNPPYNQEQGRPLSQSSGGSGPAATLPMWLERSNGGSTSNPGLTASADYGHPGPSQYIAPPAAPPEEKAFYKN